METLEGETVERLVFQIITQSDQAASGVDRLGNSMKKLEKASSKTKTGVGGLLHTIGRLTKMMLIRQAIRAVIKSFQEGAQNAYYFSKAVGGDLAQALDSLSTKNYTMTNQFGAAWATLLQTLQPILIQIINIITRAVEVVTQLFAMLGGKSTYLKAIDYSKAWADTTAKGAKAAKEWKNQLMGFDEINRLDEPSDTSSGGGAGTPDYGSMFEEVPIESWLYKYKERISAIVDDIKLIFQGLVDFIAGAFTGDWERAFRGLGKIVEGFGKLIDDNLQLSVQSFDGFAEQVIKVIDSLFKHIEDKTGLDLTSIRESVLMTLNTIRYSLEMWSLKIGLVFEDLAMVVSAAIQGDWTTAMIYLKKAAEDASMNVDEMITKMARKATNEMINASANISAHSASSHSSVANAAVGIGNSVGAAVNATADMAESIDTNLDAAKASIASMGETSLEVRSDSNSLSFVARVADAVAKIVRFANNPVGTIAGAIAGSRVSNALADAGYASGGFPDEGELFMAREGGMPEMVGRIGGRTAVANNDQIVQAISSGVYSAVVNAMSTSGGNNTPVNIYLDGREIASTTTKYQKQFARAGTM